MYLLSTKIARKSIIYILITFLFLSCDNNKSDTFPYAYVNVTLDLQNPLYLDLHNVSGSVIVVNEGYNRNGIMVYRSGIDEFKAYDCTCTYIIPDNCSIKQSENSIVKAVCPCCDSEFELFYGSVSIGPAITPLKEYQTSYDGVFVNIRN